MLKETALQKLIVEALELQIKVAGKDALVVSNYNNATSARDGAAAKRMGRKAGIPDLFIGLYELMIRVSSFINNSDDNTN